jgi:enoyl-CoA hydratase
VHALLQGLLQNRLKGKPWKGVGRKKMNQQLAFYRVEKKPPLAWVYLNRPEKKNAMNTPAWKEPEVIFADLDQDEAIRCVLLAGKGDCFSTGIDLMSMSEAIPEMMDSHQMGEVKWKTYFKIRKMQDSISCIEWCKKPVIAAIHGYCVGAGLDMVTACDIRLCSQDAIFSLREAAVGFVADVGVLQRLPLIVGQGVARELAYTAKNISADRAKQILLVNEVYPDPQVLFDQAEKMAVEIAENSSMAVQAAKNVLNFGVGKSVEDGLQYVASMNNSIVPSGDLMEAAVAFSEKRKPNFLKK